MSQKLRIQQALVDLVRTRSFPVVKNDSTGKPISPTTGTVTPLTPILCNEVGATFEDDGDYGRGVKSTRSTWTFAIRIRFGQEVLLEGFEEDMMNNPPRIAADGSLPYVQLRLTASEPQHPVQQQPGTGTIVEFTFQAQQGRR